MTADWIGMKFCHRVVIRLVIAVSVISTAVVAVITPSMAASVDAVSPVSVVGAETEDVAEAVAGTEPVAEAVAETEPVAGAEPVAGTEPVPADPLSGEAPGEAPPETDVTVPPPDDGNGDLFRQPARVLWSSVGAAERKLNEAKLERENIIVGARVLRKRRKELTVESQQLGADSAATVAELAAATNRFRTRAVLGFQEFGSGSESEESPDFSDYQEVLDEQRRSRMVGSALKFDQSDIDRLGRLQRRLDTNARAILDRIRVVEGHLFEIEQQVVDIDQVIEEATVEYEAFLAGSQIFIHGAVFPIAPGYNTPLIDSWGFPRMVGTEDEHGHEGIDIFAPRGTPLVAAERGVIERLGVGRLGGLKFWLRGESGSDWYYAHLDSFGPGMTNGRVVEAGDLLGYVGDSGNAVGTPPHLHLQLHPGGGDPVNPYPLLNVLADLQAALVASGDFAGHDYQSVGSP